MRRRRCALFFFNDTATTEIYTLSLHDALPICRGRGVVTAGQAVLRVLAFFAGDFPAAFFAAGLSSAFLSAAFAARSEEHTSELHSRQYLVCRLLLAKKKVNRIYQMPII